jgi:predicted lysophospholipase L1 biosynthesis ABC-type transport system permease subunit
MIETKVTAATLAAFITSLIMNWLLMQWPFLKEMNDSLATVILALVTGIITFAGGWLAKHTNRPDLGESK